jgi:hypothetical protein
MSNKDDDANVIEGQIRRVEDKPADLVPVRSPSAVSPVMSLEQMRYEWDEYRRLEETVLQPDDYIYFAQWKVGDKVNMVAATSEEDARRTLDKLPPNFREGATVIRRKKKSAFRKAARFFGLSLPDIENPGPPDIRQLGDRFIKIERGTGFTSVTYMDENFSVLKCEFTVTVKHPSGAMMTGVGACSQAEGRGFRHPDHDIVSTAMTRALNRAISDLVGWGEVSADEMQGLDEASRGVAGGGGGGNQPINSLARFMSEAMRRGFKMADIQRVCGNPSGISDFEGALAALEGDKTAKGAE